MSSIESIIGVVTWDFARPSGGMGRVMQQFTRMLKDAGKTVYVASPQTDELFLGITERLGRHTLFSLLLPFTLNRWIRTHRVTSLLLPTGPGGVFLLKKPRAPYACIAYHTYLQQAEAVPGEWWKKIFIPFEHYTLNRAKVIICYAEDTRRVLVEKYQLPAERVRLCTQPLNFIPAQPNRTPGLCVCVARLDTRKGIDVLMDAWKKISFPNARLTIVGEGKMQAEIDNLILESNGSVMQIQSCSVEELFALLAAAEVVICPAYLEGFGLAAAEGMLAGSCVIASDCDGLRSLIRNMQTGLLFPPGNADALAAAISKALADDQLRAQLGNAARNFIQEHCNAERAQHDLVASLA